jgi:hypothetical protein
LSNPSFSKEGSLAALGFIRGMKLQPNWWFMRRLARCQSPNFVGEDRHHPNPSSEEEGLFVHFLTEKTSPSNFTNFTLL